jgi:predicted hotdog family 3-hydroxylacyl-ACP dehydratase
MSAADPITPFPPVAELIPQRPPMLLLDAVTAASEAAITCTALVRAESPLVREGRAHAAAVLEYMAQTIAALAGLRARALGQPPALGLIAACRDLDLEVEHLHVGDRLEIDAARVWPPAAGGGELAEYRARVRRDGGPVASAVIHVVSARRTP